MESELMLSILSSLAESESVSISENEKWGIRRRFQNGTFIVSYPPYGYANVNGEMVIVPEEAEVVRSIFADCLAGIGTYRIAKRLNEENIPTKKNGKWHGGTVNGILTNEKYIGDALFQKSYTDENFTGISITEKLTSFTVKIIMRQSSVVRILTEHRRCLHKGRQKKEMERTHQDIRIDMTFREELDVGNAELHLRDGVIISQVEITLPGPVENT